MRMAASPRLPLGKRIAPPRFVLFGILFAAGVAVGWPLIGWSRGVMAAFDTAAVVTMLAWTTLLRRAAPDQMRRAANENDANRAVLLGLTGTIMLVILVAVAKELAGKNSLPAIVGTVGTLVLAWLFSNTVYALHYAHLYYSDDQQGSDKGGLDFPKCDEPDYWDFLYFSYTLGMCFQTSDVSITARRVRRAALGHSLAAFVFNLGVLAFTINVLGGSGGG